MGAESVLSAQVGYTTHFRLCSKRRKRKQFRLEPPKKFQRNRRTLEFAAHFRFRWKRGKCEHNPFRFEPGNFLKRNRCTVGVADHFRSKNVSENRFA
jgi:hypothetical protein